MKPKIWFSSFFMAMLMSCSNPDHAGGSTVETENVITATVLNSQGKPLAQAKVQIRASWYLADTFFDSLSSVYEQNLTTNANGQFECKNLPLGSYVIEVKSEDQGAFLEYLHQDTTVPKLLPKINTSVYGTVFGRVDLPKNSTSAILRVFGTDRKVETDSKGAFTMDSIPAGALRIRASVKDSVNAIAEAVIVVRPGVQVNVGSLPSLEFSIEDPYNWRYEKTLMIDSLISDWMNPVGNPMVAVVRLDSTMIDFSEAMENGDDLRFYDENGLALEYQIDYWNTLAAKGKIYVRIPSASKTDQIMMHWGCPGSIDRSSSEIWTGLPDSLRLEITSVLVGDFENKTNRTNLQSPIPPTYWYVFANDSTVSFSPANWIDGIEARSDEYGGSALHLTYTAKDNKWIFIGASLDSTPKSFANMDSITFWMKGNGLLTLSLDRVGGEGGKAVYNDSISTGWRRIRVTPELFLPADQIGGNIGWESVKDSITNIAFFVKDGNEFWIDDVRIYGLNRDDLK